MSLGRNQAPCWKLQCPRSPRESRVMNMGWRASPAKRGLRGGGSTISFPSWGPFPTKARVIANDCQRAVRSPTQEHKERLWPRAEQEMETGGGQLWHGTVLAGFQTIQQKSQKVHPRTPRPTVSSLSFCTRKKRHWGREMLACEDVGTNCGELILG